MKYTSLIFLLIILIFSCDQDDSENLIEELLLETNQVNYEIGEEIQLTLSNMLSDTLLLNPCCNSPDYHIQKFENEEWVTTTFCVYYCEDFPISMYPGETRTDTVIAFESGYQRVRIQYQLIGPSEILDIVSNPFWVDESE